MEERIEVIMKPQRDPSWPPSTMSPTKQNKTCFLPSTSKPGDNPISTTNNPMCWPVVGSKNINQSYHLRQSENTSLPTQQLSECQIIEERSIAERKTCMTAAVHSLRGGGGASISSRCKSEQKHTELNEKSTDIVSQGSTEKRAGCVLFPSLGVYRSQTKQSNPKKHSKSKNGKENKSSVKYDDDYDYDYDDDESELLSHASIPSRLSTSMISTVASSIAPSIASSCDSSSTSSSTSYISELPSVAESRSKGRPTKFMNYRDYHRRSPFSFRNNSRLINFGRTASRPKQPTPQAQNRQKMRWRRNEPIEEDDDESSVSTISTYSQLNDRSTKRFHDRTKQTFNLDEDGFATLPWGGGPGGSGEDTTASSINSFLDYWLDGALRQDQNRMSPFPSTACRHREHIPPQQFYQPKQVKEQPRRNQGLQDYYACHGVYDDAISTASDDASSTGFSDFFYSLRTRRSF